MKKKTIPAIAAAIHVALGLLVATPSARAGFDDGVAAFEARDYMSAARHLRPLAHDGDAAAQVLMGTMLRAGLLGSYDFESAAGWFRRAADQNDAAAHFNLGLMYFQHEVTPPDGSTMPEDLDWAAYTHFKRAAELGHATGQLYFGHIVAQGGMLDPDPVEAFKWYQLAAWQRNSLAAAARDQLAARMEPAEIADARQRARIWRPLEG